jgi:hypothetical protein
MEMPVVPETTQAAEQAAAGSQESAPLQAAEQKQAEGAESATAEGQQAADTLKPEGAGSEPVKKVSDETVQELKTQREKRRLAEQDAAYWRGKAEGAQPQAQVQKAQPQVEAEPSLDNFDGPTAYEDWIAARTEFRIEANQKQKQAQSQAQTQAVTLRQKWDERCNQALVNIPDLADVINSPVQPFPSLNPAVADAIFKSDAGPEMVYYLHKNPTEGARLANMDPALAIMELYGVREKAKAILQPKIRTVTQAAPPLNPGNGGGVTTETDTADLPMAEYARRREEQTFIKVGGRLVRR